LRVHAFQRGAHHGLQLTFHGGEEDVARRG
jgi:hypothetical protein